jgi:hypothetical protein
MFSIKKPSTSPHSASSGNKQNGSVAVHNSRKKSSAEGFEMSASLRPTNQPGMGTGNLPVMLDLAPTLSGFLFNKEEKSLVDIYKDIYYYDVVAGTAVDLLSFLPFSDFSLRGISSKQEQPFKESLERLNIHTLMPEISVDYLVFGTFIGSLVFNQAKKVFVDIIPQDFKHCTITELPFYGVDPIINVDLPAETVKILQSNNPRVQSIIKNYGSALIEKLLQGKLELDPLSTVYIPRRTMTCAEGMSYFRRILPIYFMEKNLYRGSLVESIKRQRAILHITAGDLDWEPSSEDLQYISELFINADNDPLGAIVATRNGVSTNDIRQGGDFWRVEDMWNSTVPAKLKALNISEDFVNGAASVSTMESSMSGFVEQLRSYRSMFTRKLFYNKLFPLISLTNEFYVDDAARKRADELRKKAGRNVDMANLMYQIQDTSALVIPEIDWEKNLKPEGDSNYIDILKTMTEAGVPVPIRAMAAAGGIKLDKVLKGQEDDIETRKKLQAYNAKIQELMPKPPEGGEGGDGGFEGFSAAIAAAFGALPKEKKRELLDVMPTRSSVLNTGGKPNLLRGHENFEITELSKTGKKKSVYNQRRANDKANDLIVKAMKNMGRQGKLL